MTARKKKPAATAAPMQKVATRWLDPDPTGASKLAKEVADLMAGRRTPLCVAMPGPETASVLAGELRELGFRTEATTALVGPASNLAAKHVVLVSPKRRGAR